MEEKKNTMENITESICPKCWNDLSNLDRLHFGMCSICFAYYCTKNDSGSAENMTKEQAAIKWLLDTLRPFENMEALGPLECFKIREIESLIKEPKASGSVAAPKEEENRSLDEYKVSLGKMTNLWIEERDKNASLRQQLEQKTIALDSYYKLAAEVAPLKEALKELLPIAEWYTTEYPMDAEDLKAKVIIERARKLISK